MWTSVSLLVLDVDQSHFSQIHQTRFEGSSRKQNVENINCNPLWPITRMIKPFFKIFDNLPRVLFSTY